MFLTYACIRTLQADVYMTAERSFLLFLTPVLAGVAIITGFSRKHLVLMLILVVIDMAALGIYGIVNHTMWDVANPGPK